MDTGGKRYAATNENLLLHALAPAMRHLIAAALDGATVTYGELKDHLEKKCDFSTIFDTRIGFVATAMMQLIQQQDATAPLLNVLVVNQVDRMPSKGAGPFMATRFADPLLNSPTFKYDYPARWKHYVDAAAAQVYAYSSREWAALFELIFKAPLSLSQIAADREARHAGNEDDVGGGNGKYGSGGESEHHRSLRLWVTQYPEKIDPTYAGARTETELPLDSGDRVDSAFYLKDRTILLEVKSRISNIIDLKRGVYQCIKYRAVKIAMDLRNSAHVDAILVTENKPPPEIMALLKLHNIQHRLVSHE